MAIVGGFAGAGWLMLAVRLMLAAQGFGRIEVMIQPGGPGRSPGVILAIGDRVFAEIVVEADVIGPACQDALLLEGAEDFVLDMLAAVGMDRVGDVGVELGASFVILEGAIVAESLPALVAVERAELILSVAFGTAVHQFATRHCDEQAVAALYQLEVANDEAVLERDGTKRQQPVMRLIH